VRGAGEERDLPAEGGALVRVPRAVVRVSSTASSVARTSAITSRQLQTSVMRPAAPAARTRWKRRASRPGGPGAVARQSWASGGASSQARARIPPAAASSATAPANGTPAARSAPRRTASRPPGRARCPARRARGSHPPSDDTVPSACSGRSITVPAGPSHASSLTR
jgi:hypothetical protein